MFFDVDIAPLVVTLAGIVIPSLAMIVMLFRPRASRLLFLLVPVVLAGGAGLAFSFGAAPAIWLPVLMWSGVCGGLAISVLPISPDWLLLSVGKPSVVWASLLASGPLTAGACTYWTVHTIPAAETFVDLNCDVEVRLSAVAQIALTDKGRAIPLFKVDPRNAHDDFDHTELGLNVSDRIRCVDSSSTEYNCHGWVFGAGQHLIRGVSIDTILADNGYRVVKRPRLGDLVVYRNDNQEVVHTGVVFGVFRDSEVMVESKWGLGCRYLHPVGASTYATAKPIFYRSERAGHTLNGVCDVLARQKIKQPHSFPRTNSRRLA